MNRVSPGLPSISKTLILWEFMALSPVVVYSRGIIGKRNSCSRALSSTGNRSK